jgi:transcriptional regulator with XRE-family HTH domain
MIRFNFKIFQDRISEKYGRHITLLELAQKSGCDRNVLSRLISKPHVVPSARIIDTLVQYFYSEFSNEYSGTLQEKILKISNEFMNIIPDNCLDIIPKNFTDNKTLTIPELFELYELYKK